MATKVKDLDDLVSLVDVQDDIKEVEERVVEYTPIVKQILSITDELDSIDEYFNNLPSLQSQVDEELSDLNHYIEHNKLTKSESVRIVELIKEKRRIRRGLCNDYEIKRVYLAHRNKLSVDTQRPFFLSEIHKKAKELNCPYRYRQIDESKIKELIK